jgi:para-nitrobenzyl esterase
MQRSTFSAAILLALGGAVAASAAIHDPVKVDTGMLSGTSGATPEMRIYKGVPFAAAPVGDLRWRGPKAPAKWDGVRKADQFGPKCMQNEPGGNSGQKVSEDCLYLNIWTSAKSAGEKRPVFVWIYGGGFNVGAGSEPGYDGEALAKKGLVVVTINYRLGAFGFLAHPELTKESDRRASGNYGLMDQVAALQWVQKNIAAFGGDPKRVTAAGESAGSMSVAYLMAAPQAKGLFQRAVGESGAWGGLAVGSMRGLPEAEQAGVKYADALGAKTLAEMRAKPADAVLKAGRGNPIVDGWFLTDDVGSIFAQGKQMDVPLLVGSNKDEGGSSQPTTADKWVEQSRRKFGDLSDSFLKVYPAGSDSEATASSYAAGADEVSWVMRNWGALETKTGKSKSYLYLFAHQPPVQANSKNNGKFVPGARGTAVHTSELPYVFENLIGNRAWTALDRQVSNTMSTYWVNFATTGDPNGKGLPKWTALNDGKNKSPMVFGDKPEMAPPPSETKLSVYQAFYDRTHSH